MMLLLPGIAKAASAPGRRKLDHQPGEPATVGVSYDGGNVHFEVGIPSGSNGSDGSPGEVTFSDLNAAIETTSANTNGVDTLDAGFADPDMETLRQKLNELISNGRR